jgi:hypothetical protein
MTDSAFLKIRRFTIRLRPIQDIEDKAVDSLAQSVVIFKNMWVKCEIAPKVVKFPLTQLLRDGSIVRMASICSA